MELETRIDIDVGKYIFIDTFDDGVWVSMAVEAARCHVTLTKEQAKDMIAALIRIVDTEMTK